MYLIMYHFLLEVNMLKEEDVLKILEEENTNLEVESNATDDEIKKHLLSNPSGESSESIMGMFSTVASPEAECCGVSACSGSCS